MHSTSRLFSGWVLLAGLCLLADPGALASPKKGPGGATPAKPPVAGPPLPPGMQPPVPPIRIDLDPSEIFPATRPRGPEDDDEDEDEGGLLDGFDDEPDPERVRLNETISGLRGRIAKLTGERKKILDGFLGSAAGAGAAADLGELEAEFEDEEDQYEARHLRDLTRVASGDPDRTRDLQRALNDRYYTDRARRQAVHEGERDVVIETHMGQQDPDLLEQYDQLGTDLTTETLRLSDANRELGDLLDPTRGD